MDSAPTSGLVYYYDFCKFGGNRDCVVFTSALHTNKQTQPTYRNSFKIGYVSYTV